MNVLFFVQHLGVGGIVRQSSAQLEHLHRRGHHASLLAMYAIDDDWRPLWNPSLGRVDVLFGQAHRSAAEAVLPLLAATVRLRRRLREEEVDVLYAVQGGVARLMAWIATRGLRRTTLVWGTRGFTSPRRPRLVDWKVVLPLRLCATVSRSVPLLVSNSVEGIESRRREGWRCRTMLVAPNGVDLDEFKPDAAARAEVRAEWGLGDEPLVGHVARFDPVKDHPTFLRAAASLAGRRDDVRFVIVGDGPPSLRARLVGLSRELELEERLIWAGVRADMPAVYNALDVLCSTSVREGGPLVIAEAMACGIPCVATDAGDSSRLIGDTGLVVPVGEPALLAAALEAMLQRLPEVRPLELRERIQRLASLEAAVDRIEAALVDVTRRAGAPGARPRAGAGSSPPP